MFDLPSVGVVETRATLLADARRALASARDTGDPAAEAVARCRIHDARRAEGVVSANWWADA